MKISIITVVYNNETTIERCIKSVFNQTYEDIEYIIIDGKSNDSTLDIINKYKEKIHIIISESDNGIYDAMNKGYLNSTGDIIGILNSDDYFESQDSVGKIVSNFETYNMDCCFFDLDYVDENGIKKRSWITGELKKKSFQKSWIPAHPTFYIKKNIMKEYGLYDIHYKLAADYDFMFRLLYVKHISYYYDPSCLVKMSLGGATNNSYTNIIKQNYEIKHIWKKYNVHFSFAKYLIFKVLNRVIQKLKVRL